MLMKCLFVFGSVYLVSKCMYLVFGSKYLVFMYLVLGGMYLVFGNVFYYQCVFDICKCGFVIWDSIYVS